jgi:hypothetical protein
MKSLVLRPTALDPEFWIVSTLPVPTLLVALAEADWPAVPKVENDGKVVELTVIDRLLSCHDV